MNFDMRLPIEQGRDAVRKALGLDKKPTQAQPFHQNPDGTLMETKDGSLSDDQIETIRSEQEDLQ